MNIIGPFKPFNIDLSFAIFINSLSGSESGKEKGDVFTDIQKFVDGFQPTKPSFHSTTVPSRRVYVSK